MNMLGTKVWIVEETDGHGTVLYSQEFDDQSEAYQVYYDLKEKLPEEVNISIYKSDKKLLLG